MPTVTFPFYQGVLPRPHQKLKAWAQDHPLSLLLGQQLRSRPELGGDVRLPNSPPEAEHASRH